MFFRGIITAKWRIVFFVGSMLFAAELAALPFANVDPRSAALGGIGVASGTRGAVFNNPALLATRDEFYDAYFALPGKFDVTRDPDGFESGFDAFGAAVDTLQSSNTSANQQTVNNALAELDGNEYATSEGRYALVEIPSAILAGAAYFTNYDYHTMRVATQSEDLASNPESYNSQLQHRGLAVAENGVAIAKLVDIPMLGLLDVMVGLTGKLLLTEGYGYDEPMNLASLHLNEDEADRKSVFQFDFGMVKEYGVWKLGFVLRNILGGSVNYGETGESLDLGPQLRLGFAYKSRKNLLEVDLDVTENEGIGYNSDTMMVASGWEHHIKPNFSTRLGYQQNLVGDKETTFSAGIGLEVWGVVLDWAMTRGDDEQGTFVQLGYQF